MEVSFASTPLRLSAWGISLLTGILLLTFALRQEASSQPKPDASLIISEREYVIQGATIVSVILVWGAAFSIPYLARPAFTQESPPGTVLTAEHPLPRQLQGGIDLLAYDLAAPSIVGSSERMQMTLYWRAVRPDLPDYQTDISLIDDAGQVLATVQRRHLAHIPTSRWGNWPLLTTYFQDTYNLSVPSGLPPGNYRIRVTVGQCSQVNVLPCVTTDPLFVRDPRGSSLGTSIVLPEVVRVVR